MSQLIVTAAVFDELTEGDYPLRIRATGSGFEHISSEAAATVGDVPVEWIVHSPDGAGFTGLLRTRPAEGARLRVGWIDTPLTDTGVTFTSRSK